MDNMLETIDKSEDKPVNNIKKRTLKIDDDETFLEGNLIEIPFVSTNRRIVRADDDETTPNGKAKKTKELISNINYSWIDSNKVKRGIEVRGSSKYGVPTIFELSVLLALFRIHAKGKEFVSDSEGKLNMPVEIKFSHAELAREMGYMNYGGSIKKRLEEALETLLDTTIYSKFNGALYDIAKGEYVMDFEGTEGVHILNRYKSYSYNKAKIKNEKRIYSKDIKEQTMVEINSFFYQSISNGYYSIINNDKYNELNSSVAKRLYLLLTKWNVTRLKYETLIDRIPLDATKEKKYNYRLIRNAFEELKQCGCISGYDTDTEGVSFYYKGKSKVEYYYKDKFKTDGEIIDKLHLSGISYDDINKYFRMDNKEYVKALCRYCCYTEAKGKIKKESKLLLLKGLKKPYKDIDTNFYD